MSITKRALEQAFVDLGEKHGGVKEDYFAVLYLAEKFDKSPEAFVNQVAFGGNDYGLDAFHIDREARNLYLFQFKWSENYSLFKSSLERLAKDGVRRVFGSEKQDAKANQFLVRLKTALDENRVLIDKVYVHLVFNGDPETAEQSSVLDSLREDLESQKHFLDDFFERNVQLSVQYLGNKTNKLGDATHTRKTRQYKVAFEGALSTVGENGETMHIGLLPLMVLYRMHREMGPRLFDRNIRFGLGEEKSPNRALRQALMRIVIQEQDPPSVFTFNHNGVTLAAERLEFENGSCTITEPRILNGAQTFLASQGEIDKMSRLTDVFENEKAYGDTFRQGYLTSDARRIVLAYKIQFRLRNIVREIVEKGANKYGFLHRARNLVWALLIQGVLNDPKRDALLGDYGTALVMEADYTEIVRRLASTRVRFLINEAISDERSRELLAAENYGFLRTKAVFGRAMDAAWDKWEWRKLSL